MRLSFPQVAGCYDKILQFQSIKHHLKPEDKGLQKNPPLTSPAAAIPNCSNLAPLSFICSLYLAV
jgi:hypothetical protein